MKKILITIDEETEQRIKDIKEAEKEALGLRISTSGVIRLAVWREWRNYTLQGIENGNNHVLVEEET